MEATDPTFNLLQQMLTPNAELPFDVVEDLGLDGTGRDGDPRFPYTWANLTDTERARMALLYPPTVAIAVADTGHFKFMAADADEAAARAALMTAWAAHAELTECDPDWLRPDEVYVLTGRFGQTWRDGSEFPRKDAPDNLTAEQATGLAESIHHFTA